MAILLPFVLTSCGDDKKEPQSKEQMLIGTWRALETNGLFWEYFQFNEDHTGGCWLVGPSGNVNNKSNWKWSLNAEGNVVTITYETGDKEARNIVITKSYLLMTSLVSPNEYQFNRVD